MLPKLQWSRCVEVSRHGIPRRSTVSSNVVCSGSVRSGEKRLPAARLDIFSDEFLERVAALEQKNLALETLRKLLIDQIKLSERTNIVQAQKFREALENGCSATPTSSFPPPR